MSKNRSYFKLYDDYRTQFEMLDGDEVKELIMAIFHYRENEDSGPMSPVVRIAFSFMADELDKEIDHYEMICERNQINGAKGGRPPRF